MRDARVAVFLTTVWLAVGTSGAQQQDFDKVEIKATHVAGRIYMLEGSGGNIGVSVGPDGILIVDDQFAPLAGKIKAALAKLGPGKLRFVLNTHWHGDHTGGNPIFGREATLIAHENVRKRLSTRQEGRGRVVEPAPEEAWPVITFDDDVSIHFNGEEIRAVHLPSGHTDGDSVIFFSKSNVVHMGDDFFAGRFPFVDLASGGNVEGLIRNLESLFARLPADVKLIPGHGPLSSLEDLRSFHRMLVDTTEVVRSARAEGKSLTEIQGLGLPELYREWGSGFIDADAWIEIVHRSLEAGTPPPAGATPR